jgi:hypothetical protein
MSDNITGLLADIFKHGGRSHAGGGISDRFDECLIVGDFDGPARARPGLPILQIVPGNLAGTLKAIPVLGWEAEATIRGKTVGPMFGGSFVWSSDGRFRSLAPYPVPIHDRFETPETYRQMSS